MKHVFIDSDVFVRDLRYPRDQRSEANRRFLETMRQRKGRGVTSIFNALEVCGILSFNLSPQQLVDLYGDFCNHYRIQILFPADAEGRLQYDIPRIFSRIQQRQSLGDAQVAYVVDRFANDLASFVSWNVDHFAGKLPIPVTTPEHFLR